MPTSGDVVRFDLGTPEGREAGYEHPAVVVTAQRILDASPSVVHVVPLTTTLREFGSEVQIDGDAANGLAWRSSAQCQHIRTVAAARISECTGNVGPIVLRQIRETLAVILDLPG